MRERPLEKTPRRLPTAPLPPSMPDDATMLLTKWTPAVGFDDGAEEVESWIPVRGFGAEAGAWTPPPVYPDPDAETSALRQIEDELYRLSGGNVIRFRPTGPVFGPPGYEISLLYIAALIALAVSTPSALSVDARFRIAPDPD